MSICANKWIILFCMLSFMGIKLIKVPFNVLLAWQAIPAILGYVLFVTRLRVDLFSNTDSISKPRKKFIISVVCYSFAVLFSSLYNGNLTAGVLYTYTFYIGVFLYVDYCLGDIDKFLEVMTYIFGFIVVGSFIYAVISPGQAYHYIGDEKSFIGVLGAKNAVQLIVLPGILIFFLRTYFKYNRMTLPYLILIGAATLFLFLSGSGTAIIVTVVLIVCFISYKKVRLTFKGLSITYIIIYLAVVIFRVQERWFSKFITETLGKDITLSGRTVIWDHVLEQMKYSPIIGYGSKHNVIWTMFPTVEEAHNGLIEIFLISGGVGLGIFVWIILIIGKELQKNRENTLAVLITLFLFAYFIIGLTESVFAYSRMLIWIIFVIAINIERIIKQSKT